MGSRNSCPLLVRRGGEAAAEDRRRPAAAVPPPAAAAVGDGRGASLRLPLSTNVFSSSTTEMFRKEKVKVLFEFPRPRRDMMMTIVKIRSLLASMFNRRRRTKSSEKHVLRDKGKDRWTHFNTLAREYESLFSITQSCLLVLVARVHSERLHVGPLSVGDLAEQLQLLRAELGAHAVAHAALVLE